MGKYIWICHKYILQNLGQPVKKGKGGREGRNMTVMLERRENGIK